MTQQFFVFCPWWPWPSNSGQMYSGTMYLTA